MRLPVYGVPRILDCGYEDDAYLGIPRGCRMRCWRCWEEYGVPAVFQDHRCAGRAIDVSFRGTLRPEQEAAAQALLAEEMGFLSAAPGFGKTVIGAYLIGQRKTNTLILVQSAHCWNSGSLRWNSSWRSGRFLPELPRRRGRAKRVQQIGQIGQIGAGKHSRGRNR